MPSGPSPSPPGLQGNTWNPIVISLVAVVCAIFLFLSYYNILRRQCPLFGPHSMDGPRHRLLNEAIFDDPSSQFQSRALDSAIINALPTIQFKKVDAGKVGPTDTDCAVCLGEFEDGERLRSLPNCGHIFHISCIDTWFRTHSSCPLCRSNVVINFNGQDDYSISMFALLQTLRREEAYRERWHGYAVIEPEIMENSPVWRRSESDERSRLESAVSSSAAVANDRLHEQGDHRDGPPSMING
ncbi:RING-H2 finger protein ATL32-like [Magnolia sinica]|uniref:RING-H2 finger protein ATL32-like n=1 Tax=Magnolia sinica TaxID=86752 RepID=UPI002657FE78|nr:RING-H2 finger protein ATL32-like [Magnolia sinica]